MANMNSWMQEAQNEAKKYSDALKQENQQILDQLTKAKESSLQQLQEQQNNAIYNINSNKSTINSTAEDNAKQLNINRLLALKSNQSAMNRAGLGTQGIVGSQVNSINNNYGTNLSSVLNQKASDLQDLEKQKNDTLLSYNTNRLNLSNQYDQSYSDALASINDKALSQYNTVYQNYLAMKQQEYENEQAELARQEAIRQYNANLALQYAQLQASSSNYQFDDNNYAVNTAYYQGSLNKDAQNGTFSNGYQPNNVNGVKLTKTGNTITFNTSTLYGQKQTVTQNIWKAGNKYYYWDGRYNKYIECTKTGAKVN